MSQFYQAWGRMHAPRNTPAPQRVYTGRVVVLDPPFGCRRLRSILFTRGRAMTPITALHVNGAKRAIHVDAERTLLSVLRDDLDLTGSKYGCGEGQCGACTVLIDGKAMRSCRISVGLV